MSGAQRVTTKAAITAGDIVATLKNSSLPTVVVEGADDLIVYRKIESQLAHLGFSVLPVGGRINLLEVFQRRTEIRSSLKLAFIADQDTWVYSGVPSIFQNAQLITTAGYSIENDVFCDGDLINLLSAVEVSKFRSDLASFLDWYAVALSRHLSDATKEIAVHPNHVFSCLTPPVLEPGEAFPTALRATIDADFARLVRGKSLMALLVRNTNYKGRQPRHTDSALMESVAARPGANLKRISCELEALMSV